MLNKNKSLLASCLVILGQLIATIFLITQTVTVQATPIPIGCPGSSIQGPVSPKEVQFNCSAIPAGCPGTLKPEPVSPPPKNCPYDAPGTTPAASPSTTSPCGAGVSCSSGLPVDCRNDENSSDNTAKCINGNKIVTEVINPAIKIFSVVVGVVAVIMLIIGGILYSASQDDPKRVALARKIIIDVVIGVAAYALLFAFVNYILPQGVGGG